MTGVDPQKIEVRKYGHNVPLADGTCQNCGRPVRFNLAAPIVIHVGGGEPNDCRDPWPAVRPVEALTGIGVSATIQEAPQRASGDRGARVDGSGATVADAGAVISDEAVRAAAEAIEDEAIRHIGRDLGTVHRDDIVRAGLAAALPLLRTHWEADLRERIAREVVADAAKHPVNYCQWTTREIVATIRDEPDVDAMWAELENAPEHPGAGQPTEGVLREVADEMARQDAKWGEQNHPDGTGLPGDAVAAAVARTATDHAAQQGRCTWRKILAEEVFEAFAETDPALLRAELVQVEAVCAQWRLAIDRRAGGAA